MSRCSPGDDQRNWCITSRRYASHRWQPCTECCVSILTWELAASLASYCRLRAAKARCGTPAVSCQTTHHGQEIVVTSAVLFVGKMSRCRRPWTWGIRAKGVIVLDDPTAGDDQRADSRRRRRAGCPVLYALTDRQVTNIAATWYAHMCSICVVCTGWSPVRQNRPPRLCGLFFNLRCRWNGRADQNCGMNILVLRCVIVIAL